MRIGSNPQKNESKILLTTHHRLIVVVYIPNEEGFYKKSFDVFKLCLDSIIATINNNCAITVVNNGSYEKITALLNQYFEENKIDTLVNHRMNIGKIDALIGAARGSREPLITYTDSDILFVEGWQENVEKVFSAFNNVGSVSPIPVRHGSFYATSSVLKEIILNKIKINFVQIHENFDAYNKYLESINWEKIITNSNKWAIIESNGCKAVIGSGHQVLTILRDILFTDVPTNPSLTLVGGDSEYMYVDEPIDRSGKLRLSTYHNFGFHMGNNLEDWMLDVQRDNLHRKKYTNTIIKSYTTEKATDLFSNKYIRKFYLLKKNVIKKIFKRLYKKSLL